MSNFARLNEILRFYKDELNSLYQKDSQIVKDGLEICGLKPSSSSKIAILRRVVDLKEEALISELKKSNLSEEQILEICEKMYDFVAKFYTNQNEKMLQEIENEAILTKFDLEILRTIHEVGKAMTEFQKSWQKKIINTTNKKFFTKFKSLQEATNFINENKLYQTNSNGTKCDRTYGAIMFEGEIENPKSIKFKPYALAFEKEINLVAKKLQNGIEILENLDKNSPYVKYFKALKMAFLEKDNEKVIKAWQDTERAWMDVRGAIQPGHPLEYYEDAYTHAVAPEWDARINDDLSIDEASFKAQIKDTFDQIYAKIGIANPNLEKLVHSNLEKTQLYISNPAFYYGAEFNGLFSAQVVPNNEVVSLECGKKIFAFVNFVYESAKAKPFMKLGSEIFSQEFLDYGREILFLKPEIWKKVYEISTIGHEFGHILFIDQDSENLMNRGGEFKFIEEYKATSGGLINFFLHEDERYKMAVFYELIKRSIGLIAWQKVDEVRAYYCEGLMHLKLLFEANALEFNGDKLSVNFTQKSYENFKSLALKTYQDLALHYAKKLDASQFLSKFCKFDGKVYLPLDEEVLNFVKFYHDKYEKIGNEILENDEWKIWQDRAKRSN